MSTVWVHAAAGCAAIASWLYKAPSCHDSRLPGEEPAVAHDCGSSWTILILRMLQVSLRQGSSSPRALDMVGIALAVAASVGNLMICQNRARSLADLIAFDAAYALWHADIGDPCALAANMAEANGVVLGSCSVRDEDVLVTIKVETMVLVASSVERMARAGPVSCTEGDNYHNNGP